MPVTYRHALNERYKGASRFELRAPDAEGVITVWARTEDEARDHLLNALFDLVFRGARIGAAVVNPKCPFCAGRTQRHGRNSAGKRSWKCQTVDCGRYFVLDRVWRGGINHPSQSKKPAIARLILAGLTPREAAEQLGVNIQTARNWAEQVAANNPEAINSLTCPCGRPIRHRGSCSFRMGKMQRSLQMASRCA
jgi:transposase-like protein